MKKFSDPKALTFGVWDLKTSLGQFGPKVKCVQFPESYETVWYCATPLDSMAMSLAKIDFDNQST